MKSINSIFGTVYIVVAVPLLLYTIVYEYIRKRFPSLSVWQTPTAPWIQVPLQQHQSSKCVDLDVDQLYKSVYLN